MRYFLPSTAYPVGHSEFSSPLHQINWTIRLTLRHSHSVITAPARLLTSASSATLRAWNVRIDEALFLGGKDKGEF